MLDELTISKAITENFMKDFLKSMDVDVAIGGAGPAGRRRRSTCFRHIVIKLSHLSSQYLLVVRPHPRSAL